MDASADDIVGLVPAAGLARRLGDLPCSKELYPIDLRAHTADAETPADQECGVRVACSYMLEAFHEAEIRRAFVILRDGKWDIPAFLGDGEKFGLHLAYLLMRLPYGVPFTLDQAYPFIREARVALGFPDILFRPSSLFRQLFCRQSESKADVVLALAPTHNPHKADLVETDAEGRVRSIVIKPDETSLRMAWIAAVWTPVFTEFMHRKVAAHSASDRLRGASHEAPADVPSEVHIGEILKAGLQEGLAIETVSFSEGRFLDIGTPGDLAKAVSGSW